MYRAWNSSLKSEVINIFPGELYVSNKPEIITTVLGSCIAVCLYDPFRRVGGMNHFMLPISHTKPPPPTKAGNIFYSEELRYGTYSMEVLISELQKLGAERANLRVKYFGGGKVLRTSSDMLDIGQKNIQFIEQFLASEKIPVEGKDVGGKIGRKIFFLLSDYRVFSKDLSMTEIHTLSEKEAAYREKIIHENTTGSVELF